MTIPPQTGGMDIEAFRKHGYKVVDQICDYYARLNELPVVAQVEPGYLVNDLPTEAPKEPEDFSLVASDFQSKILPGITHWSHPRFFAYFPAITNFESILADMMATSVSNPGFNWSCSPACTELEQVMLDWAAKLLGLQEKFWNSSKQGGGQITGAASESAIVATVAARERCLRMLSLQGAPEVDENHGLSNNGQSDTSVKTDELGTRINDADGDVDDTIRDKYHSKLVMYGSTQTHSIGIKAAKILGLKWRSLPTFKKDHYALTGETVRKALEEDEKKGLIPFMLIGTIGTTSTGTVDRLSEIGQVLKNHPTVFLYIDAAWAGTALAVPEHREALQLDAVNEYADGICTNFHKWGLVAFDCSALWVRDRKVLTNALDVTPAFLRTKHGDTGLVVDYRNWSLSLGRRFRSLKLWFVLRSYGVEGFRAHIRKGVQMAAALEKRIRESKDFELVTPRSLALLVFRLKPSTGDHTPEQLNELNRRLQELVHAEKDFNMTQTVLPGEEGQPSIDCMRFAMGALRTTEADAVQAWQIVERLGASIIN
ncbi:putative aromatic-L-amino-acid decarboxylase [Filobasidium floriforme]|uniref:putative aromatic-L-amino-acid decarboxylase n=1 Tax=Filobasidium floriforme TaxID=5210 RepID=UPI001E8E94CE|nr:putative aromatic-L-amino-acid decarboxylase [Filobasidium floriforme]KAH8079900.1 putative aromatic-L-amino-acid decarboxylase [Filobasidium floriforme]